MDRLLKWATIEGAATENTRTYHITHMLTLHSKTSDQGTGKEDLGDRNIKYSSLDECAVRK